MPNFAAPPPANPNNNQQPQRPQNDNANRYQPQEPVSQPIMNRPSYVDKLVPTRRPPAPPIRIDTCIVGDDTTCQIDKHEVCRTHLGVSSCDCKPGYGRGSHRKACKSKLEFFSFLKCHVLYCSNLSHAHCTEHFFLDWITFELCGRLDAVERRLPQKQNQKRNTFGIRYLLREAKNGYPKSKRILPVLSKWYFTKLVLV